MTIARCPCGCGLMYDEIRRRPIGDHPHTDPGDGRVECDRCGKFVRLVTHSCKGIPVTGAAKQRGRSPEAGS